jgi:hypothetical protein
MLGAVSVARLHLRSLRQTALAHSLFGSFLCVGCFCLIPSTIATANTKRLLAFKAALEDKFATGKSSKLFPSLVCQCLGAIRTFIANKLFYRELCHFVSQLDVWRDETI